MHRCLKRDAGAFELFFLDDDDDLLTRKKYRGSVTGRAIKKEPDPLWVNAWSKYLPTSLTGRDVEHGCSRQLHKSCQNECDL